MKTALTFAIAALSLFLTGCSRSSASTPAPLCIDRIEPGPVGSNDPDLVMQYICFDEHDS